MQPWIGVTCSVDDEGYHLGLAYVQAVEQAGGLAAALPCREDVERWISGLRRFDAILLSGGADLDPVYFGEEVTPENGAIQPERDRFELAVARYALSTGKPLLAVCRGMQVLNVAAGGDLYQDIHAQTSSRVQHQQRAPRWYPTHSVRLVKGTRLHRILGVDTIRVNSFHHQAVRRLGEGIVPAAHGPDGIIEAIEVSGHPFAVGVQWHPEHMAMRDAHQRALFAALVAAARRRSDAA